MRVTADSWHALYSPTECAKRVRFIASGAQGAAAGPYERVLEELARRHENEYLASLEPVLHIGGGSEAEREAETLRAIEEGIDVIYQPFFRTSLRVGLETVELVGTPDFLIKTNAGYVIRDVKQARRHTSRDEKPEVYHQLHAYGFLFEQAVGRPAAGVEVFDGQKQVQSVDYEGPYAFLDALRRLLKLRKSPLDTYEPVGWSKCQACRFKSACWADAEARQEVSLVYGVNQEMAKSFHAARITRVGDLADMEKGGLAQIAYRWGDQTKTVGMAAESLIVRAATALKERREIVIRRPRVPRAEHYVTLDLEGLPAGYEIDERIYLWGIQVFGADPGPYQGVTADFGREGDRLAWFDFLDTMGKIFAQRGDIPVITYSPYEATHIKLYLRRFGDLEGIGKRVLKNVWDMLPVVKRSMALPLYSYGLKQVEQHVGFKRTQDEVGGTWAVAQYIQAMETGNPTLKGAMMKEILTYNQEDLAATWAVFEWLRSVSEAAGGPAGALQTSTESR